MGATRANWSRYSSSKEWKERLALDSLFKWATRAKGPIPSPGSSLESFQVWADKDEVFLVSNYIFGLVHYTCNIFIHMINFFNAVEKLFFSLFLTHIKKIVLHLLYFVCSPPMQNSTWLMNHMLFYLLSPTVLPGTLSITLGENF